MMDTHRAAGPTLTLTKSRIEPLSDGVFAIAMTLLVLELRVPTQSHQHSNAELVEQIQELGPSLLSFALTFLIAGGFRLHHHFTFHFIRHTDRVLCWINLVFLMFVSLLPFSAGLLGHLFVHPVSQLFYFGNLLLLAILLNLHWYYARYRGLASTEDDPREVRKLSWNIGAILVGFVAAIAGAMIEPMYSAGGLLVGVVGGRILENVTRNKAM